MLFIAISQPQSQGQKPTLRFRPPLGQNKKGQCHRGSQSSLISRLPASASRAPKRARRAEMKAGARRKGCRRGCAAQLCSLRRSKPSQLQGYPGALRHRRRSRVSTPRKKDRDFSLLRAGRACGVPQFQLPQRTPGQTRQARDGRRGPPGGAWAGPGAHCGGGPAWVLGLFGAQTPKRAARWSAKRHSLLSSPQVAKAPHRALLSAQPRPAAGRATPWPGPPCDRPPQSASVEEVSRLA